MGLRVLPATSPRVETGAVQFGDDWPGLFIRGDNAIALALAIQSVVGEVLSKPEHEVAESGRLIACYQLRDFANYIMSDVVVKPGENGKGGKPNPAPQEESAIPVLTKDEVADFVMNLHTVWLHADLPNEYKEALNKVSQYASRLAQMVRPE